MMDWIEVELGMVAEIQTGPFGSLLKQDKYISGGTPVITVGHIRDFRISDFDFPSISVKDKEKLAKYMVKEGDILFTRIGSVDLSAYVGRDKEGWLFSSRMLRIRAKHQINSRFLAYYFQQDSFRVYIRNIAAGATMPSINTGILKSIPIAYPGLKEQESIASILTSLDDKIDLLYRQNQTLEKLTETLFRQWFVERPSRAWKEQTLSSIATFTNGLPCQKYPPRNDSDKLPILKIKELRNGIKEDCDWCSSGVERKFIVKNGDVILSWSGSFMVKVWSGETCVLNQHLFKVTSQKYPKWFYYLWCKFYINQFTEIANARATTIGHIKKGDLDKALVLIPSDQEFPLLGESIDPLIEKMEFNNGQINKLMEFKKKILHKLMTCSVQFTT